MTEQVRVTYRGHRKAAWVVMLALVGVLAAVVIPLASGGGGGDKKSYTLTATAPAKCASPATTTVTIKNTSSPQYLGSAEIYFPPNTVDTVSSGVLRPNTTSSAQSQNKDILALEGLNLAPNKSRSIIVTFKAGVTFDAKITAVAKQSNHFNDSGGSANLFTLAGSFPTLTISACVTVSGRVYLDRNHDGAYTTDSGATSDLPKAWTVSLFKKFSGSYSSTPYKTTTASSSDGTYSINQVPTGYDVKVCVSATGDDVSGAWGLRLPTGNSACGKISDTSDPTSAGSLLPGLSADAGGQDFAVEPMTAPFGAGSTATVGGYTVTAGTNSTKDPQRYVQETWVDANGRTNFRFAPIIPCADCAGNIYLLESLKADLSLAALNGNQVRLLYDDDPRYYEADLAPMPYCLADPRSGTELAMSGVLPGSATSCIVTGSQAVSGGSVHAEYLVYTSYDGGRQISVG